MNKSKRPLAKKDSIHLVLRSEWAMDSDSFLAKPNQQAINSNYVHLLLKITSKTLYTAFIKAVSSQIASHTMPGRSFKMFASAHKKRTAGDGSDPRPLFLKQENYAGLNSSHVTYFQ